MKKIILIIVVALCSVNSRAAFQTIYGQEVVITDSVENDLYISAGTVRIEAPVHGDILICGGTVTISSNVTGSIFVLGGELIFTGWVEGNLRCAGGKAYISGVVLRDLVIASGDVTCDRKSVINGGILAAGGKLTIDGLVKQNVQLYAGAINLGGQIEGDLNCKGDVIYIDGLIGGQSQLAANEIQIGDSAVFQDRVSYWDNGGNVDFKNSMFGRKASFDSSLKMKRPVWQLGFTTALYLTWYLLAVFCLIILSQYLLKRVFKKSADRTNTFTARSFGYGILFMFILPAAIAISIISLIGIPIGMLLIVLLFVLAMFNSVLLSVFASNWINNKFNKHWRSNKIVLLAFLLFIGLKIITVIPFVGWFTVLVLTAMMFGAVIRNTILKARSN